MRTFSTSLALVLISLGTTLVSRAQSIDSNGTGGGDWSEVATWAGIVPTTESWQVLASDTVVANAGVSYDTVSNNVVFGTLTINTGASITMGRLNNGIDASGTVNIVGGSLSISRYTSTSGTALIHLSAGAFTVRDTVSIGRQVTFTISGGTVSSGPTGWTAPTIMTGGIFIFENGASDATGFSDGSGSWNGGVIVTNSTPIVEKTGLPNSFGIGNLLARLPENPANMLVLSSKPAKQTVDLSNRAATVTGGGIGFHLYSSTNDDSDQIVSEGDNFFVTASATISIYGKDLAGAPADYIGKSYKLFWMKNEIYAGINATVAPSVLNIGGTNYSVAWTNTLGSNGTLTIAGLTPAR